MGHVVLVPPKARTLRPQSGYSSETTPVVFYPSAPVQDNCVVQAHVPIPKIVEIITDPMFAYTGLLNFGQSQSGARDKRPATAYYGSWPTQLTLDELRTKFWDFTDLREFVRDNLASDLLAQYDEDTNRWNFLVVDAVHDQIVWNTRVSQHKAVEFALDHRLKDRVTAWLKTECGIFDLIENRGYGATHPIRVYIKDEDEALYFKLRWSGIDVEKELAEPA